MIINSSNLASLLTQLSNKDVKDGGKLSSLVDDVLAQNLPKGEKLTKQSLVELMNSLFKGLSEKTVTKENVLQTLQQSGLPKISQDTTAQLKSLLNLVKQEPSLAKFTSTLENLLTNAKNINGEMLKTKLDKTGVFLESKLATSSVKTTVMPDTLKEVLSNLKQAILKNENNTVPLRLVNQLLNSPVANKKFFSNLQELVNNIKNAQIPDKHITLIAAKLENLLQKSTLIESKIQNQPTALPNDIKQTTSQIKQVLQELQTIISENKLPNISKENAQTILQTTTTLMQTQEFFPKQALQLTLSQQIERLVSILKQELTKTNANFPQEVKLQQLTLKLEQVVKSLVTSNTLQPNQQLQLDPTNIKQEFMQDIKATLLTMKKEISSLNITNAKDMLANVDKVLNNIDYFQLLSYTSQPTSYIPFTWDGLENGQISFKNLKENRFFCEINLTLKEYDKVDLMIMLSNDNTIDISVFAPNKKFLDIFKKHLQELKVGLNTLDLIPSSIQLFNHLRETKSKQNRKNYGNENQARSGIDIEC